MECPSCCTRRWPKPSVPIFGKLSPPVAITYTSPGIWVSLAASQVSAKLGSFDILKMSGIGV